MTIRDRMALIALSVKDLDEAAKEYAEAKGTSKYKVPYAGCEVPMHCSKESIKRRIKQIRQDLLLLEKEL